MADIELMIKIPEEDFERCKKRFQMRINIMGDAIANGTPLTPDILADLLMKERIRGELKQDISYSKDIIEDVRCTLTVSIRDRRPCYCGAELREVWRESEGEEK